MTQERTGLQGQEEALTAGRSVDVEANMNSSVTGQHLLLGDFVVPFTKDETDPTGVTTGIPNGRTRLWINNGQLQLSIFSQTLGRWSTLGEAPVGTIWMYSGPSTGIGGGWQLCDGTNGTPDLRDKFVLGSGWDDVGTVQEAVSTVIADHGTGTTSTPSLGVAMQSGTGQLAASDVHEHSFSPDEHVITSDYVPPSYKVAFIMKVT